MNSNDCEAHPDFDQITEESSNIIPSSETDPPPPVSCHVPPCKSSDLFIPESETINSELPPLSSCSNSSLEDTTKKTERTFTQADDFQDISKESECEPVAPINSEDSNGYSVYRLGDSLTRDRATAQELRSDDHSSTAVTTLVTQDLLTTYPSLSDLPVMSQTDRIDLVWNNQDTTTVLFPRGSTPVNILSTANFESKFRSGLGAPSISTDLGGLSSRFRASEPAKVVQTLDTDEPSEVTEWGLKHTSSIEELPTCSLASTHQGESVEPLDSNSSSTNNAPCGEQVVSVDSSRDQDGTVDHTDSGTRTTETAFSDKSACTRNLFANRRITVHLSMTSTRLDETGAQPEPMFLEGFSSETSTLNNAEILDQLNDRMYCLWAKWNTFVCSELEPGTIRTFTEPGEVTSSASKGVKELWSQLSSISHTERLKAKPLLPASTMITAVVASARTSSSSSDLFVPRSQRRGTSHQLGRILPLLPATARSSTSSSELLLPRIPRVRQLVASSNKLDAVSSPSPPESSPPVTGTSTTSTDLLQSDIPSNGPIQAMLKNTGIVSKASVVAESKLTLVPESPAEETEGETVISHPQIMVPETASSSTSVAGRVSSPTSEEAMEQTVVAVTASTDTTTLTTMSSVPTLIAPGSDEPPITGTFSIYGRWPPQPYFYAGILELPQPGIRRFVQFEDGSRARLRPSELLYVNLLPVSAEVCADWTNNGEFLADCVVEAHLVDSRRPYLIFCRIHDERKALARKDVAIHQSQVSRLRDAGLLPPLTDATPNRSRTDSTTRKRPMSRAKTPKSVEQLSQPSGAILASSEVSLNNVLFSKRQPKVKRYRSSWATPITRLAAEEKAKEGGYHSDQPNRPKLSKSFTSSNSPRSATQDRKTVTTTKHKRLRQRSGQQENRTSSEIKKPRLLQSPPYKLLSPLRSSGHDSDWATPPIQRISRTSMDASSETPGHPPNATSALIYRRSLSRCLGIPVPSSRLFSGWKVMLTGRMTVLNSPGHGGRDTLEQLVVACGGEIITQITPILQSKREPNDSPILGSDVQSHSTQSTMNVALVAPDSYRTLKYFQALATLGRVPLLHTDWILDACREESAAGRDENMQPGVSFDWPMHLLISRPGRYELPRGVSSIDGERISWHAVPVRYRSPAYQTLPPLSLFELRADWLGSQNKCELVAIVTDDMEVFGPAWTNILQLASGAPLSSEEVGSRNLTPIPTISIADAPKKLRHLLCPPRSRHTPQRAFNKGSLVLIDVADLPSDCMTDLDALPCQLVTCDYFIQSLICGHLLNPVDSSAFVPPRH